MNRQPITLYRSRLSGHCHRVQLMMSVLGLAYETIEVELGGGEHKRGPFMQMNAFSQVPVIDDNGLVLADSNAILVYLVKQYGGGQWLPEDAVGAAHVQRWLSVAAGPVAYGLCRARLVTVFGAAYDAEEVIAHGHQFLKVLETELAEREWLAGETATIADIANYAYVAHAPEGNIALDAYPKVRAWITRVEGISGFVPMGKSVAGLVTAANAPLL